MYKAQYLMTLPNKSIHFEIRFSGDFRREVCAYVIAKLNMIFIAKKFDLLALSKHISMEFESQT